MAEAEAARIEVFCLDDGTWLWSYRAGDVELISNQSFGHRSDARASARRAYPHLSEELIHVGEASPAARVGTRTTPAALVVGAAVILLAWRNRRAAARSRSARSRS